MDDFRKRKLLQDSIERYLVDCAIKKEPLYSFTQKELRTFAYKFATVGFIGGVAFVILSYLTCK